MLCFAILELLHRKPLSGYELRKRFDGSIVFFWHAGHSQIYPELKRMERERLVEGRRLASGPRPPKTVYAITAKGREALRAWLLRRPNLQSTKDEMMLKCFAFHLIPADEADEQIRHHLRLHEERLAFYLEAKAQLEAKHGELAETDDPILFWNALTLHHSITSERMYVRWCRWALRRHQRFLWRQRLAAEESHPAGIGDAARTDRPDGDRGPGADGGGERARAEARP